MDQELLFAYFTNHCGNDWQASVPVALSAWEIVEALWPLNEHFRPNYQAFRALPYHSAYEAQADEVLTRFAFEGIWGLVSVETWRVILERQQQAIVALPLHEVSGGAPRVYVPPMLPQSALTGAAILAVLHGMKLPLPVADRADFEPAPEPKGR
ncbi:MAG TPA: hypothetical protein VGC62_04575 [Pseudomonas sp.]|uniref:hypothetical protein n=1 Tax=Pseudomonas sp. TaxID=306 RepID=UPI002ED8653E